jgi:hypothetical protein
MGSNNSNEIKPIQKKPEAIIRKETPKVEGK